jgi:hypothetical protein
MKTMLTVSTGVTLVVWRQEGMFHTRVANTAGETQICLPVDLFEVIAELAGLDLDDSREAAEAIELAERSQRLLSTPPESGRVDSDEEHRHERERT